MTRDLTATEAVLAIAAAETRLELHAGYLALIDSGGLTQPVVAELLVGDGTAGARLLGDVSRGRVRLTAARRARAIAERHRVRWRVVGADDEPLEPPPGPDRCPGSTFGLVHRPDGDRYGDCRTCGRRAQAVSA